MEKNVALIALFAAVIAALGLIPKITLGFGVPITAQTLGVMLCGTVLGARRGTLSVLLFLLLVAIGLPLLSGGRGGLGAFATPSAGFLLGWPIGAFVTGLIVEKWRGGPLGCGCNCRRDYRQYCGDVCLWHRGAGGRIGQIAVRGSQCWCWSLCPAM